LGKEIKVQDVFVEGDFIDAVGTSKGKGFQGVVNAMVLPEWVVKLTDSITA
jgi:ribosomal protein L3